MGKDNVLEIYDEAYAQEYNQKFLLNMRSKIDTDFEEETINKLLSEIGNGATWLDVACGTGYFLSCFPNVERAGLDISPAMLKVAKQANPDALFVQGDYRDQRPQWEGKWDLVTCMWWAYGYVESLSQLEIVVENLTDWTSERGVCFLPICVPEDIGAGNIKLPYSQDVAVYGGTIRFEGIIWSWTENVEKLHLNLLAPQLEYMVALFKKYFEQVEIIDYPLVEGACRKAIVARSKKQKEVSQTKAKIEILTTNAFFSPFFKAIRSHDWWLYKIPPLLTIAYAEILLLNLPVLQSLLTVAALLFAIACVAAYGHIINDSFDVEVDRQVGKRNAMAQFSLWQRALFCLALAGLGFSLPVLMKFSTLAISLLGINYLLPTLYSAPPFRFKEKGILGILSDAAGAHAIPTLFIATTFAHLVAAPPLQGIGLAIAATAWSSFAGIRGILLHQLWDRDDDLRSQVKTLVTESNVENVRFWMSRIIFPIEMLLLGSLILVISYSTPLILVFTVFYFLSKLALTKSDPTSTFDPAPVEKSYVVPHDFYEVGLPLILVTALSLQNPWFAILLLLQVTLFYPGIERRVTNLAQSLRGKPQDLNPLQTQLTASQAEVAQLQTTLQQTQNQLEQVQSELQTQLNTSHAEVAQLYVHIQQAQNQLGQVREQLQHLQTEAQRDRTQTQAELANLQAEIAQAEAARQTSQVEAMRLKAFLQTQGSDGLLNYYRHAIATNPDDIQLYYQALEIQPDDVQFHLQLGNALVRQGQITEAIARYQIALQLHPDQFELHFELAKALEKNQQWDDALASYRRAIGLNPNHSLAHQHLGDALAECGRIHEASLSYRHALQLQYKFSESLRR
ncbi:MAG TPA: tetratricopeptide repeat protein [Leptolyngbyaceae cyanobacterium M33_DOE_097]|uniref:Tetratricopeptide repeat protein n=1 Tax=Oscillatoriales cyanobacterium SpSt-418 TaxID=2282169 RepID=A0A7C3PSF7_9CYAN|nr:tetratricopeptide repeat protein [Leptolyngbyaceae cyanobacterium M33_DOE_097]